MTPKTPPPRPSSLQERIASVFFFKLGPRLPRVSQPDPPDELRIHCVDEPLAEAPFAFCHHPRTSVSGFVVAGHIHPAVTLRGRAEQRERLPCFLVRPDLMILPAFGSFTGHGDVVPVRGDAVYVIADGEVLNVNSR